MMTKSKHNLTAGITAMAALLICSPALAGLEGSAKVPTIFKGGAAPIDPGSFLPFPNRPPAPFAFADFPDLPGRVPPPLEDKNAIPDHELLPPTADAISFGRGEKEPPDSRQTFILPRPDIAGEFENPMMPRPEILPEVSSDAQAYHTFDSSSIPAPGSALLLIAGAAAMRRRR